MKKIGFIGTYDKTDLILNIAKILTTMGRRVIMVDLTLTQREIFNIIEKRNNQ